MDGWMDNELLRTKLQHSCHSSLLVSACFVFVLSGCILWSGSVFMALCVYMDMDRDVRPPAPSTTSSDQQTGENKQREQIWEAHTALLPALCVFLKQKGFPPSKCRIPPQGTHPLDVHRTLWRPSPLTEKSQEAFNFLCKPSGIVLRSIFMSFWVKWLNHSLQTCMALLKTTTSSI